jgi:hypothetical protein
MLCGGWGRIVAMVLPIYRDVRQGRILCAVRRMRECEAARMHRQEGRWSSYQDARLSIQELGMATYRLRRWAANET